MYRYSPTALYCIALIGFAAASAPAESLTDNMSDLRDDLAFGKVSLNARYRWEHVDQIGFRDQADASTVRLALGYETKPFHGLSGYAQYVGVFEVGDQHYDPVPGWQGNNRYPVVQDPQSTDLNQAYAKYQTPAGPTQATIKAGRQQVIVANQRFIGNVGWRQIQQSFDGITGQLVVQRDVTLGAGYLSKVHRITGDETRNTGGTAAKQVVSVNDGLLDMHSGFAFANDRVVGKGQITAYAVALNYVAVPVKGNNSLTGGLRVEGPWKLDPSWSVIYAAEAADQRSYADYRVGNVTSYHAWYYQAELGIAWQGIGFKAGWDVLQGEGPGAKFNTPLATGHAFNGWAEKFLTTPDQGLDARYLSLGGSLKGLSERLDGLSVWVVGYRFYSQSGDNHYGDEIDANIEYVLLPFDKDMTIGAKCGGFRDDQTHSVTTGSGGVLRDTVKSSLYTTYNF